MIDDGDGEISVEESFGSRLFLTQEKDLRPLKPKPLSSSEASGTWCGLSSLGFHKPAVVTDRTFNCSGSLSMIRDLPLDQGDLESVGRRNPEINPRKTLKPKLLNLCNKL